jgi:broad specificity phosphatase PhoE
VTEKLPPVYFVRHGETEWNRQGIIQGCTDIPLNDTGHAQAKTVAKALKTHVADTAKCQLVMSPLTRTRQTMGHIADALEADQHTIPADDLLKELGFGIWEGKPFWELKASPIYPADPESRYFWRPEGGESYEDGAVRLKSFLAGISAPTIVVSHGALGRCLIGMLTGMGVREMMGIRMVQGSYCRIAEGAATWFDGSKAPA